MKTYVLKRPTEEAAPRTLSIDYAAALNSQQLAAVTAGDGPSWSSQAPGAAKLARWSIVSRISSIPGSILEYLVVDVHSQVGSGNARQGRRSDRSE